MNFQINGILLASKRIKKCINQQKTKEMTKLSSFSTLETEEGIVSDFILTKEQRCDK